MLLRRLGQVARRSPPGAGAPCWNVTAQARRYEPHTSSPLLQPGTPELQATDLPCCTCQASAFPAPQAAPPRRR